MTSISLSMPWRPPWLSQYAWSRNRDCSSFSLSFLLPSTDMTSSGSLQTHKKGHEKKQSSWVKLQHTKVWDRWRWWVRPSHPFQQQVDKVVFSLLCFCHKTTFKFTHNSNLWQRWTSKRCSTKAKWSSMCQPAIIFNEGFYTLAMKPVSTPPTSALLTHTGHDKKWAEASIKLDASMRNWTKYTF